MSDKKPTPVIAAPSSKICPVCGQRSYSAAGIHPQCAAQQADAVRREELKAEKKIKAKQPRRRSRDKKCPQCGVLLPVRRKTCDCGYAFFAD